MSLAPLLFVVAATTVASPEAPNDTQNYETGQSDADALGDLDVDRIYNKPGATKVEYVRDWDSCRLIARGTSVQREKSFGALANSLATAIDTGRQRRQNRKFCMLNKGWRVFALNRNDATVVRAMSTMSRKTYFERAIGAVTLTGSRVSEWTNELAAPDLAPYSGPPATEPVADAIASTVVSSATLTSNQGIILVGFRRSDPRAMGRKGTIILAAYDAARADLSNAPNHANSNVDIVLAGRNKNSVQEYVGVAVPAGDYVLSGAFPDSTASRGAFCFGAPAFHVNPGEIVYFGDFTPYFGERSRSGKKVWSIAYSNFTDDALAFSRRQISTELPFHSAEIVHVSYSCVGEWMSAYYIPDSLGSAKKTR